MKKLVVILFLLMAAGVFAQQNSTPQKFALVIGNAAYTGSARLKNPVNDANDIAAALQGLGFTVDKVIDGSLDDMEKAIIRLKNRLSVSNNTYGFFFYAGHGVQSNGVNYLIPVGANISGENYLRERAVSVQTMLAELNDAGNELNVIVLDACRDNPFEWSRGRGSGDRGGRGLTVVSNQPADSILVYATSAGSIAADGEGRNGLFTSQLLKNLKTPGLEVSELFRLTGADVSQASGRRQIPAIYNQFFGRAYLGSKLVETITPQPVETAMTQPIEISLIPDDEAVYSEPGYKWGLLLDIETLGATMYDVGLGLSLFNNNVRIQGQYGLAPLGGRYVGNVFGIKLLANIFYLPLECLFGPGWSYYSMNFALGANFSYFSMDERRSPIYMSAVLAQWDIANIDFQFFNPGWKYFSKYALYLQPELWFASSDVKTENETIILRVSVGMRLNWFMNESKVGLKPSNKINYSAPSFIQGLYFDGSFSGGLQYMMGMGLTFFDDNVKVQTNAAHVPSGTRYSGWAFGGKVLANVYTTKLSKLFGPDWEFYTTSLAIGAHFSYFLMEEGENEMWVSELLGQWEIIKADMSYFFPEWKYFKSISLYMEPGIWFAPSDVTTGDAWRTLFTIGFGARISLF